MDYCSNQRGFSGYEFVDHNGIKCSIQESSAIGDYEDSFSNPGSSFLWLGVDDAEPVVLAKEAANLGIATQATCGWVPYPIPDQVLLHTRMHLDREQVASLVQKLQHWLNTHGLRENTDG